MRLLILDDYPVVRAGIKQILSVTDNVDIVETGTIRAAINAMASKDIEVAFVDIDLGGENGFDFISKAKKISNRTKYIVLSSTMKICDIQRAKNLGANGYLLKNAFADDILYALKVVMRGEWFYSNDVAADYYNKTSLLNECLTKREKEVFDLLRTGRTNQEIGRELFISEATAKKHVSNILGKLGLKHRVEAALLGK